MSDILEPLAPVQRHAGGLHTVFVRLPPGARVEGHRHNEPTMVLVHRGTLLVSEGNEDVRESAGTLRLSESGTCRTVYTESGADCLIISCHPDHVVARHAIWRLVSTARSERYDAGTGAGALVGVATSPSADSLLQIEEVCLTLLTELLRTHRQAPPPWLGDALSSLSDTNGRKGAVRDTAQAFGVHPVHLARVIRQFTGLTIRDFLRRERIVRAARLLRTSTESVSWVAHQSGFADHSHFTREFARRHGQAPSVGRRSETIDVASIQASEFPGAQIGRVSREHINSTRHQGEAAWDGKEHSKE
jgi:AraC family transcriptional regulator